MVVGFIFITLGIFRTRFQGIILNYETVLNADGVALNMIKSDVIEGRTWIVLIMPFGIQLQMADVFVEFFSLQYNVVTYEARSILEQSERGVSENEFSIENHVEDLKLVIEACASEKFYLVGYCSGAGVALAAAKKYPELVEQLILVHGEYAMLDVPGCTSQFAQEVDSLLSMAAKDEEHLNLVFKKISGERFENTLGRPEGIDLAFTDKAYLRRYAANYLEYKRVDFCKLANDIKHKTLIMAGEKDLQSNVKSAQTIQQMISNSEIYIDPDADHYGLLRDESNTMVTIWNYLCNVRP